MRQRLRSEAAISLLDRMEQMTVAATSPQGAARASLSRREGVTVALQPGCTRRFTERSLAAEVSAALSGVLTGYANGTAKVFGRDPAAGFHPEMDRRVAEIVTRAQSRDGYVKAERRGKAGFEVRLRPGSFAALTEAQLSAEIASAVAAVEAEHGPAVSRAHRATFQKI